MLGVAFVFLSLFWFCIAEILKGKEQLPFVLQKIAQLARLVCCCSRVHRKISSLRTDNSKLNTNALKEKADDLKSLNYMYFLFILFGQMISYLSVWLVISL